MKRHVKPMIALAAFGMGYGLAYPNGAQTMGPPSRMEAQLQAGQPSANATVNLIRLLVDRGILTAEEAVGLIRQAEQEARIAQAQTMAIQAAAEQIQQAAADEVAFSDDDIRVTYVPEHVRREIAEDVRHEMLQQARAENWGGGTAVPGWVQRTRLSGDMRLRMEAIRFASDNLSTGAFPDFNAINTGAPFDVAGEVFSPQLNTDQDRQRFRLRLRLALENQMTDSLSLGIRMATGGNNSPVTTNQTLGAPGNFSRYAIWLDRAWLRWEYQPAANWEVVTLAGRFANPFLSTDIAWDGDLGFDGMALRLRYTGGDGWIPFLNAGAFPVFNTALNYPTHQPAKNASDDRYVFGIQGGLEWAVQRNIDVTVALGYYDFNRIEGMLSEPFVPLAISDAGSTDSRRPAFAQKGNTYMALRDILPVPANDFGTRNQWQYFGLASPFRVLSANARVELHHFEPFRLGLFAEYLQNLAFDRDQLDMIAVNNRGPLGEDGATGRHNGGNKGWIAGIEGGHAQLEQRWQWTLRMDYRMLESDAMVDGFVDSDFGLGGTNVKGFSLSGRMAWNAYLNFGFRWLSASEVSGPPMRNDVFQLDLNSKF